MKIVADSHIPFIKDFFGAYDLILKSGREIAAKDVQDATILLVRSITHVDEKLLSGSSVQFVGSVTAGADHVDTAWLDAAGIAFVKAQGFNAPAVADYIVSVIACLQKKKILETISLKAAVIGVGHVGRLVVNKLQALNINTLTTDPIRAAVQPDFISTPLDELADLDLILLHVPLTRKNAHPTYHFIGTDFLRRQKKGCILINASRGAVIDDEALMQAGQHLTWCLDVWSHEPNINQAVLEKAFIATPHIAGYSIQSKIRGVQMIDQALRDKKIISATSSSLIEMPHQHLTFSDQPLQWQDIILGIFNPFLMTEMMRTQLLSVSPIGQAFDGLRHQFNYRHECAFTSVTASGLSEADIQQLKRLGIHINHF